VVSFSSNARIEILFTAQQNVDEIKSSVFKIKYYAGGTRIDLGLKKSHQLFSDGNGRRANVPHVLLVVTDGKSNNGEVLGWGLLHKFQVNKCCQNKSRTGFKKPF